MQYSTGPNHCNHLINPILYFCLLHRTQLDWTENTVSITATWFMDFMLIWIQTHWPLRGRGRTRVRGYPLRSCSCGSCDLSHISSFQKRYAEWKSVGLGTGSVQLCWCGGLSFPKLLLPGPHGAGSQKALSECKLPVPARQTPSFYRKPFMEKGHWLLTICHFPPRICMANF